VLVVLVLVGGGESSGICCGGEGCGGICGGNLRVGDRWKSRRNSSGVWEDLKGL
jgi:hypothetical protein